MGLEGGENSHIVNRTFGRRIYDEDGNRLIKDPATELIGRGLGIVDSITTQLALQEHYETYYGICDHDSPTTGPLALVTMHKKERYDPYGRYDYLARMFLLYDIRTVWGYTLDEFLSLPRARLEQLMQITADRKSKKDQQAQQEDARARALESSTR